MKYLFIIIAFFFSTQSTLAQKKFKFGSVSDEELKMTTYEADPDAGAVVLNEKVRAEVILDREFGLAIAYYVHRRIKILSESGFDEGDIAINYIKRNSKVTTLKGMTIGYEKGKVVKQEIKKSDIFNEKISRDLYQKKFAFKGLKPGVVLDLQYAYVSANVQTAKTNYFQKYIPVKRSEYSFTYPEQIRYDAIEQLAGQSFSLRNVDKVNLSLSPEYEREPAIKRHWIVENLPALKDEDYIPTMDDYRMKVVIQISEILGNYGIKNFAKNWGQLNSALIKSEWFGEKYLKGTGYKKLLKGTEIVRHQPYETDLDKIKAYHKYISNTFKSYGAGGTSLYEKIDYLYEEGLSGEELSGHELNMMLLVLLREEGIDAYPVMISTRDNGKINTVYPVAEQFNHVIVEAIVGEKHYYIDATDPKRPFDLLPENYLSKEGWRVSNSKHPGQWLVLPKKTHASTVSYKVNIEADGTVKGNITGIYSDYAAQATKESWEDNGEEQYLNERIKSAIPDIIIESIDFKKKGKDRIQETIKFEAPQLAEAGEDVIYITPLFKEGFQENLFKTETRSLPVDLPFPMSQQHVINLRLPDGYIIEELPKPQKIGLPGGKGSLLFLSSKLASGEYQVISKLKLKETFFAPEEYTYLRAFFDKVIELHTSTLVAKKVQEVTSKD